MPSKRDSQKQRVYTAEQYVRVFHDIPIGNESMTTKERCDLARKFVKQVCKRKYITRKYGTAGICAPPSVQLSPGNTRRWAHAYGGYLIELPKSGHWGFTQLVVLHELAHIFERRQYKYKYAGHDWTFAAIFLDLVRNVMGRTVHDALKASFKENKVRTKPKGKRNLSPEQREAARQRMAKARAVRAEKMARREKLVDMHTRERMTAIHKVGPLVVDKHPDHMTNEEIDEVYRRLDKYEQDRKRAAIPPVPVDPFSPEANINRWKQEMAYSFQLARPDFKIVSGGLA
jgi:putative metallohydrolase (TIGR04338 family)